MAFSGTLDTVSLAEILGFLEVTQKTGTLHVTDEEPVGTLQFLRGALAGGEAGSLTGPAPDPGALEIRLLDVCCTLGQRTGGGFEFEAVDDPGDESLVTFDAAEIFTRAQDILTGWSAIEAVIPTIDARPILAKSIPGDSAVISRDDWTLFRMVDGRHSVGEIAARLQRSAFEVCRDVKGLIDSGLVVIEGSDVATEVATDPGEASGPEGTTDEPAEPAADRRVSDEGPPRIERRSDAVAAVLAPRTAAKVNGHANGTPPAEADAPEAARPAPVGNPYDELRSLGEDDEGPNPFENFTAIAQDTATESAESAEGDSAPHDAVAATGTDGPETADADAGAEAESSTEAARDRGALLRLFSGLRDQ